MPLDDNDKKAIAEMIKAGLTEFGNDLDKRFVTVDAVGKIVEQGLGKLDIGEQVKKALADHRADDKSDDDKGKGGDKADPEVKARLDELQARLDEERKAREAAEQRARQQRLEAAARDALAKSGVPAERIPHAMAFLKQLRTEDGKPVLDTDEHGNPLWRDQRKGYVENLAVEAGVKAWSGTDDAKVYLPPTGRQGTGDGIGAPAGTGSSEVPRDKDGNLDVSKLSARLSAALSGATLAEG